MRRFLNAVIEVKQKVPEILPKIYQIMQENQWVEERRLFFMEDTNSAKTENRTVHAMMCKAFPQVMPYWHPTEESQEHEGKWYGYFCNFPGLVDGKVVFMPEDEGVTREMLTSIAAKIPRPYGLFQADIALDGICWYRDSNTIPALDWQELEYYQNEQFMPGQVNNFFCGPRFFQSNSVFLEKRFDMKPEIRIQIELTPEHPREEALAIVEKFQAVFGTPKQTYTKIYTIAVPSWEQRELLLQRRSEMQEWYNEWCTNTISKLKNLADSKKASLQEDVAAANIKTLQKRFLREHGLKRHEIRPWDDYGWCKQVAHNFWIYVDISSEPIEPENYYFEHGYKNRMRLRCYGDNFHLYDQIDMKSFVKAPWNIMSNLVMDGYSLYLKLFEEEVIPKLAEMFGDTDEAFYQESHEHNHYWQQNLLGGWMDERRRNGYPIG